MGSARAPRRFVWFPRGIVWWMPALLLHAACAGAEPPSPLLVEVGQEYYLQYCAACHGLDGRGDGPAAAALGTKPADLTRIAARRGGDFPVAEISRYVDGRTLVPAHGSREMPVWGRRFGQPISDDTTAEEVTRGKLLVLVEYLRSIQAAGSAGR